MGQAGVPSHVCAWLLEPPLPRATLGSCPSFGRQGCVLKHQGLGLSWEDAALLPPWPLAQPSPGQVMESSAHLVSHPHHPSWSGRAGLGSCLAALGIPVGLAAEEELSALRSLPRRIFHLGLVFEQLSWHSRAQGM